MKRYLNIAKQVAKEKIGTKDSSVNTEEIEFEREHFIVLKDGYTKLYAGSKSLFTDHWPSYMNQSENFISLIQAFSLALNSTQVPHAQTEGVKAMATSLESVANGLLQENKIADYCVQSSKSGFLETTHKICDVFIKDVNELRAKQELARLQLAHTQGQLKGTQKKAQVVSNKDAVSIAAKLQKDEAADRIAQEEYDIATSQFKEGMTRLDTAGREEFVSSLSSLAEAHLRSMEDGVALWKGVLANLALLESSPAVSTISSSIAPSPSVSTTPALLTPLDSPPSFSTISTQYSPVPVHSPPNASLSNVQVLEPQPTLYSPPEFSEPQNTAFSNSPTIRTRTPPLPHTHHLSTSEPDTNIAENDTNNSKNSRSSFTDLNALDITDSEAISNPPHTISHSRELKKSQTDPEEYEDLVL